MCMCVSICVLERESERERRCFHSCVQLSILLNLLAVGVVHAFSLLCIHCYKNLWWNYSFGK